LNAINKIPAEVFGELDSEADKGRSSKLLRDRFPQLKELCPGHLWAPSCYHKTFQKSFINKLLEKV
jgi:hypothetical protein